MNQTVEALLRELAVSLGTTIDHLYAVLTRQGVISGVLHLLWGSLLWIPAPVLWKKRKSLNKDDYRVEDARLTLWVSFWIYSSVALILTILCLHNGLSAVLNPEYWALNKILQTLRGASS